MTINDPAFKMKRFLLTCLVVLVAASALLAADDHIENGSITTKNGVRVSVVYVVLKGSYQQADLIFPDGHQIKIAIEDGTSAKTLDKALQQIADEQN